ncbi:hypothetical protein ONS95_013003 [Cadophora gregata]|uniref:uncharacterized protein n=1 Tax=Cadophora gregata TaxID=51156 RepID=UPI0026DC796B|nr:uncharacterized protein ONS95_013003 [Cadophora gregata]KAK0101008.1 hypothetical protein ONS96_006239 [Cadophora gregata f. sp. sojae]KAK0115961.1 hypothetical protein ONS95_013003 [Cadophora gregata]
MYALRYWPRRRANGLFYKGVRYSHQAAIMNPQADTFQPASPRLEKSGAAPQKSRDGVSTDDIDAVTQSLKKVSIKGRNSSQDSPKPTKHSSSRAFIPNDRNPKWHTNQGRNMNGTPSAKVRRDAIIPPSPESGGIPNPSKAYLSASNEPVRQLPQAQHLLVVVDLNGTLLFRPNRRAPSKFIARPNTARFLRYCINTFTVVIWSSARPENVKLMCDAILDQELRRKVVAIWGREMFGLSPIDYNARTQCYKRLTKLWDDPKIAAAHPSFEFGGRWSHVNTVLVDDSPEKGRTEPFNMISIPEFFGDENEPGQILPQVHDYLNSLSMHSNVAAYLRARPFRAALPVAGQTIQYHA